jgi:hypothetical protein
VIALFPPLGLWAFGDLGKSLINSPQIGIWEQNRYEGPGNKISFFLLEYIRETLIYFELYYLPPGGGRRCMKEERAMPHWRMAAYRQV